MSDLLSLGPDASETHEERHTMTVTSVDKDLDRLTLTLVADFDAPTERVWQLWANPRRGGPRSDPRR
jgi:anti-sigma-K factor RskA